MSSAANTHHGLSSPEQSPDREPSAARHVRSANRAPVLRPGAVFRANERVKDLVRFLADPLHVQAKKVGPGRVRAWSGSSVLHVRLVGVRWFRESPNAMGILLSPLCAADMERAVSRVIGAELDYMNRAVASALSADPEQRPWVCPACNGVEYRGHKAHTNCPNGNSQDESDDRPAPIHPGRSVADLVQPRKPETPRPRPAVRPGLARRDPHASYWVARSGGRTFSE